jgi:(1->4)-alpha-D-glucan 1-alpha-D-glucosylmutase
MIPRTPTKTLATSARFSPGKTGRPVVVASGESVRPRAIPVATYRLQLQPAFTFADAKAILDYIRDLNVSHIYASPLSIAAPGSTHGYDVCGFETNPALGGETGFQEFTDSLRENNLSLLADIVPNHMGAHSTNLWWMDVLRRGRRSRFARHFDIDWNRGLPSIHAGRQGKVLLPILGKPYAEALEAGEIRIAPAEHEKPRTFASLLQPDTFRILCHDTPLPVSRESHVLLEKFLAEFQKETSSRITLKNSELKLKRFLIWLNGKPGYPQSFDRLHELLGAQHYRLAFWKRSGEEINYRRFFEVDTLVSLRMERRDVFESAHRTLLRWIREGKITALRVDHPDGLADPKRFFDRLQKGAARAWRGRSRKPFYVVAEKILSGEEHLAGDWKVDGTTGYEFLNRVNGLFVAEANAALFDRVYRNFSKVTDLFGKVAHDSKIYMLRAGFCGELENLADRLYQLAAESRYFRDLSRHGLRDALTEFIACFPAYRTYMGAARVAPNSQELDQINTALSQAARNSTRPKPELEYLVAILKADYPRDFSKESRRRAIAWVMRFQQLTGPTTAKGIEDTAFYRFNRLLSLNEVGGEPDRFGIAPAKMHDFLAERARLWPRSLSTTATHDTKRGEDSRARLNVLSEMPERFEMELKTWSAANSRFKSVVEGIRIPEANDEWLIYQTLIGAWPAEEMSAPDHEIFLKRLETYVLKAVREAKIHTVWAEPNVEYEKAVIHFLHETLREKNAAFLEPFTAFRKEIAYFGHLNSLAQTLIKIAAPGIPDFYQGCEFWDLSLVDPDNRRAVDYKARREMLSGMDANVSGRTILLNELMEDWASGGIKMFVTREAMKARARNRVTFERGGYKPLAVAGARAEHIFGFLRRRKQPDGPIVAILVPRLSATLLDGKSRPPLGEIWGNTFIEIPRGTGRYIWRELFSDREVLPRERNGKWEFEAGDLFKEFPMVLLEAAPRNDSKR